MISIRIILWESTQVPTEYISMTQKKNSFIPSDENKIIQNEIKFFKDAWRDEKIEIFFITYNRTNDDDEDSGKIDLIKWLEEKRKKGDGWHRRRLLTISVHKSETSLRDERREEEKLKDSRGNIKKTSNESF